MCPARTQGGRWRRDPGCASVSKVVGFPLAIQPALPTAGQRRRRQVWLLRRLVTDVHRPQCPANRQQVLRIEDLLVTQELGPRPVRRIREIVCQLARRVPSPHGLRRIFAQKRETGISVTEGDHVAGDGPSAAANSRTCRGPSSSGPQSPSSKCPGVFPLSSLRGRWNQRRTPTSLYAPARSPTTKARKWRRAATASGVVRVPAK